MSIPNIPDINPKISLDIDDVIKLMLSSISFMQISLANLVTEESETLEFVMSKKDDYCTMDELLVLNKSIEKVINDVSSIESLLISKLKYIREIQEEIWKTITIT